jgi:VWFA-related protein
MSALKPLVLSLALAAVASPATVLAQAEGHSTYASVLDRRGSPVTALTAADFIVREDGVQREVLGASPASEPMRIAVLVDTSQAMYPHVNALREALRGFFRQLQGEHEIGLFEFGDRATRLVDYTSDPTRLEAGVGRVFARMGTGSYVLDAIVEAARGLRVHEGRRAAIVVITAEGPEFSERYHKTVLDELRASDAALHSFVLPRRHGPFSDGALEREFTLAEGATMTGGRREDLLTSMSLPDRLNDLAAELKTQYRIVYARPDGLIAPGSIDVGVNRTALKVRAPRVPMGVRAARGR